MRVSDVALFDSSTLRYVPRKNLLLGDIFLGPIHEVQSR